MTKSVLAAAAEPSSKEQKASSIGSSWSFWGSTSSTAAEKKEKKPATRASEREFSTKEAEASVAHAIGAKEQLVLGTRFGLILY